MPSDHMTVASMLEWKGVKPNGTAVSVNDRLIRHSAWADTTLADGDRVVIISAAFGG